MNINACASVVSSFELLEQEFRLLVQVRDSKYLRPQMRSDGLDFETNFTDSCTSLLIDSILNIFLPILRE